MIYPLRDLLVIRPAKGQKLGMVGSLYLSDMETYKNKTVVEAEVVSAGPKAHAKAGDVVKVFAYGEHLSGDQIEHDGEKLWITRERDIVGLSA